MGTLAEKVNNIKRNMFRDLQEIFPVESETKELHLEDIIFEEPKEDINDAKTYTQYKLKEKTYSMAVKGKFKLTKKGNTTPISTSTIKLCDLPIPDNRDVFVHEGKDYIAFSQMRMSPGMYAYKTMKGETEGLANLRRGRNFRLNVKDNGDATVKINNRTFPLTPILTALGVDKDTAAKYGSKLSDKQLESYYSKLTDILAYSPDKEEDKKAFVKNYFGNVMDFDDKGARVNEEVFKVDNPRKVTGDLLIKATEELKDISSGKSSGMDKDDIIFQEFMSPVDGMYEDLILTFKKLVYTWKKKMELTDSISKIIGGASIQSAVTGFFNDTSLINHVEERNPLQVLSFGNRLTKRGEGGLTSHAKEDTRAVKDSYIGFVDPVVTPESVAAGLTLQKASDAFINDNKDLVTKVYPIVNGKIDKAHYKTMSMWDMRNIPILTPDYTNYDDKGNLKKEVWVRFGSELKQVPSKDVEWALNPDPNKSIDPLVASIPAIQHNDSTRLLMGNNMLRQAMPIKGRELPIMASVDSNTGEPILSQIGKDETKTKIKKSPIDGTVVQVTERKIVIEDSKKNKHTVPLDYYTPLNGDSFIKSTPKVKVGDSVTQGQLIADGWYTKDGALAVGTNLNIAFMPWKGHNFEDGIAISEDLVKSGKMSTEHLVQLETEVGMDEILGGDAPSILRGKFGYGSNRFNNMQDGVITVGAKVKGGDMLVAKVAKPSKTRLNAEQEFLSSLGVDQYIDTSLRCPSFIEGEVIRVEELPGMKGKKIKVHIYCVRPIREGSKFSGVYGNKGVVTHIVPSDEVPFNDKGEKVEVFLSPLGVPSRKNIGQLMELLASKIAKAEGKKHYPIKNFSEDELKKMLKRAKELGIEEKEYLIDPKTGKKFEVPVTFGKGYFMTLEHDVELTKYQARGLSGSVNTETGQPVKKKTSEKTNPQSMGEMELRSLLPYGADHVLEDVATFRSGGLMEDSTAKMYFMQGLPLPDPKTPQSMRALDYYARAMGFKISPRDTNGREVTMDEKFKELLLLPSTGKDIKKWSSGEVKNGKFLRGTDLKPDKGGLFDPEIFGESLQEQRTRMGHITLPFPIPNPMLLHARSGMNPYVLLTGMSHTDVKKLTNGELWYNPDTKKIISEDEADKLSNAGKKVMTSGHALRKILSEVDPKKTYQDATEAYKKETDPSKKLHLASKAKISNMLVKNNVKPEELVFTRVPVLPVAYRDIAENNDGSLTYTPINNLYQSLVVQSNRYKDLFRDLPVSERKVVVKDMFETISGITGAAEAKDKRTKQPIDSLADNLSGKYKLVRRKQLGRSVMLSGRSTLSIDPKLPMDDVKIPKKMALTLYEPFVINNLRKKGLNKKQLAEKYKVSSYSELMKRGHPDVIEALKEEMGKRPVIINRAPTLHKYGLQALRPTLSDSSTIQLNMFSFKGLNGDIDGDTVALHVPLSERAATEAMNKMRLSSNIINPTNNNPIATVDKEALLGLAYATDNVEGKDPVKSFGSINEMLDSIKKKDIRLQDVVKVNGKVTTAGKAWVNSALPEKYQKWDGMWDKKYFNGTIASMLEDMPHGEVAAVMNKLKDIGFSASTIAPVSFGLGDFVPVKGKGKFSRENPLKYTAEVMSEVAKAIEDRPSLKYIVGSGARANAGNINHIIGTRGVTTRAEGGTHPVVAWNSYSEGLPFHQYIPQAHDTRVGVLGRSWKSFEPGMHTRRLWHAIGDEKITEHDCKDTEGMEFSVNNRNAVLGHYLLDDAVTKGGDILAKKGTFINSSVYSQMKGKVDTVRIRCPLKCKSKGGLCAVCYGLDSNTNQVYPVGANVGTVAAQAIGEPLVQAAMETFHVGTKTTDDDTDYGAKFLDTVMLHNPKDKAVLATFAGKVERIDTRAGKLSVKPSSGKSRMFDIPKSRKVIVKVGDSVAKGDPLTDGDVDFIQQIPLVGVQRGRVEFHRALGTAAKNLGANMADNHFQVIAKGITRKLTVEDPGSSDWVVGDIITETEFETWKRENATGTESINVDDAVGRTLAESVPGYSIGAKLGSNDVEKIKSSGKRKLVVSMVQPKVEPMITSVASMPLASSSNWFSQIGYERVKDGLVKGAVYGMTDQLNHNKAHFALGWRTD